MAVQCRLVEYCSNYWLKSVNEGTDFRDSDGGGDGGDGDGVSDDCVVNARASTIENGNFGLIDTQNWFDWSGAKRETNKNKNFFYCYCVSVVISWLNFIVVMGASLHGSSSLILARSRFVSRAIPVIGSCNHFQFLSLS